MNTPRYKEEVTKLLASLDAENNQEQERETEKPEIQDIYVLIVREREEEEEKPQVVDNTPAPVTPKQDSFLSAHIFVCFSLFLIVSTLAFQLYCIANPLTATITIIPKSQQVILSGTVQLGRVLPPLTISQSQTTATTGKGHQDAKAATGYITFYNGQFQNVTIAAGTILTGASGIQIVTDQDTTIPAGNPPRYGQINVSAYAINQGVQGNIPAYDINQACCATSVLAKNTQPFTGGQDKRDFSTVSTQDINTLSTPLKTAVAQSIQGALTGQLQTGEALQILLCSPTVTPDHQIGSEATTVKVTVSETCGGIVYNDQELTSKVTQLLIAQATRKLGAGYSILGNPQITITSATLAKQVILSFTSVSTWVYALSSAEQQHIQTIIAGKTKANAIQLLHRLPGIESVSMQFAGFGDDSRISKNLSNIHLLIFYGS